MEKEIKKNYLHVIFFIIILSLLCIGCKRKPSQYYYIFEFDEKKGIVFTKEYLQKLFGNQYIPCKSVVKAKIIAIFTSSRDYNAAPSIAITSDSFIVGTSDIVVVTSKNEDYPGADDKSRIIETKAIEICLFCDDASKGVAVIVDFEKKILKDLKTFNYKKENIGFDEKFSIEKKPNL